MYLIILHWHCTCSDSLKHLSCVIRHLTEAVYHAEEGDFSIYHFQKDYIWVNPKCSLFNTANSGKSFLVCVDVCVERWETDSCWLQCLSDRVVCCYKTRQGGFTKVCRTPLTCDKRPESELHYLTPSLRGLCQDRSKDFHFSGSHSNTWVQKAIKIPFK